MTKIFISQPMSGKTTRQIKKERSKVVDCVQRHFGETTVEALDTVFKGFDGNSLEFLGKSIMKGLAKADVAVFVGNWQNEDGCQCAHFIAEQYKVPCFYVKRMLDN
jgi:hypothetical protein